MGRGAKGSLLASVVGAAALVAPALSHATAYADFSLRQPNPCLPGSCRVVLEYDTSSLTAPVTLAIVWNGNPGDGAGGTADAVRAWHSEGYPVDVIDISKL